MSNGNEQDFVLHNRARESESMIKMPALDSSMSTLSKEPQHKYSQNKNKYEKINRIKLLNKGIVSKE